VAAIGEQLPILAPEQDEELMQKSGIGSHFRAINAFKAGNSKKNAVNNNWIQLLRKQFK
jgi:hypothetical protein